MPQKTGYGKPQKKVDHSFFKMLKCPAFFKLIQVFGLFFDNSGGYRD